MRSNEIVILEAGGHAKFVASTAISARYSVAVFYCDNDEIIGSSLLDITAKDIRNLESDKKKMRQSR